MLHNPEAVQIFIFNEKQYNQPIQFHRTAAPLARVTQPTPNLAQGATNFSVEPADLAHYESFGVTNTDGIVYVYNVKILNKSSSAAVRQVLHISYISVML